MINLSYEINIFTHIATNIISMIIQKILKILYSSKNFIAFKIVQKVFHNLLFNYKYYFCCKYIIR